MLHRAAGGGSGPPVTVSTDEDEAILWRTKQGSKDRGGRATRAIEQTEKKPA